MTVCSPSTRPDQEAPLIDDPAEAEKIPVFRPMVLKQKYDADFLPGRTIMGDKDDVIHDRQDVFNLMFQGKKVPIKKMFQAIKYYSPTGLPRSLPLTQEQLQKYNAFVKKRVEKERVWDRQRKAQLDQINEQMMQESVPHV